MRTMLTIGVIVAAVWLTAAVTVRIIAHLDGDDE